MILPSDENKEQIGNGDEDEDEENEEYNVELGDAENGFTSFSNALTEDKNLRT